MDNITYWIEITGKGHSFYFAYPICLLILMFIFQYRRKYFLVPSLLISLIILNPWFYGEWSKRAIYAYWRTLWMIPLIPIVAAVPSALCEKVGYGEKMSSRKTLSSTVKTLICSLFALCLAFLGTYIYTGQGGDFIEAENTSKLPGNTVDVANRLLELKERPRIITDSTVGTYIRQYTGEIDILFGRNIYGYISDISPEALVAYDSINNPTKDNMSKVSQIMLNDGYDYIVIKEDDLDMRDFELVERVNDYSIYKAKGIPSVKRIRNEFGQVISETTLDSEGNPADNVKGYATVFRRYDDRNNVTFEYRVNKNGIGVLDESGSAGYEKEYDKENHIIMERILGKDGKPTIGIMGYAEVRREYKDNVLVYESYFDQKGNPTKHTAGFFSFSIEYDAKGQEISKCYYDQNKELSDCIYGYSKIIWEIDNNGHTRNAVYYDTKGNPISQEYLNLVNDVIIGPDGWSEWMTPKVNGRNVSFVLGNVNLGKKTEGDKYSCEIEVEFRSVKSDSSGHFRIWTQGSVDGAWTIGNIWDGSLLWLGEAPKDGVYHFSNMKTLDNGMAEASSFSLGFRCDDWKSGSFRVRNVNVYKIVGKEEVD